ncbi:MAG: hypothetical protein NT159_08020 [Proteobacteria bacterium]|nr:hypothetical protein [Pseudomonadota bacterium]
MKFRQLVTVAISTLFASVIAPAAAESFNLTTPKQVIANNVVIEAVTFRGRPALKVELTDELQKMPGSNPTGYALLPVEFENGTVEVDIAGVTNGKGPPEVRAFAGIAFHILSGVDKYEAIYLRMSNGRLEQPTPTEPRSSRAIQYVAHPDFHFDVSRKNFPGKYESGANIASNSWIHLRLEIDGNVLQAFVNDEKQASLTVTDLKLANATGKVGLWVGNGTAGYFSNARVGPK